MDAKVTAIVHVVKRTVQGNAATMVHDALDVLLVVLVDLNKGRNNKSNTIESSDNSYLLPCTCLRSRGANNGSGPFRRKSWT